MGRNTSQGFNDMTTEQGPKGRTDFTEKNGLLGKHDALDQWKRQIPDEGGSWHLPYWLPTPARFAHQSLEIHRVPALFFSAPL